MLPSCLPQIQPDQHPTNGQQRLECAKEDAHARVHARVCGHALSPGMDGEAETEIETNPTNKNGRDANLQVIIIIMLIITTLKTKSNGNTASNNNNNFNL